MSVFLERLRAALGADYDVMNELASGGMGVVYRARDRSLDRLVAIKIIRPDLATASIRERFLREARILASCSHPSIVPVHRAGEADGIAYYVMDYLEGETLADRLRRGPLTADEFTMVSRDLLAALEVVHQHGVVHRDVKPANIFLTAGRAVLSDFGISKPASADVTGLTAPGHIVGTPGYMPPEQLTGNDVTVRTDVCAAGMVLFEACTGRPWSFDSHTEEVDWSRVPIASAPAIRRALAWSPAERPATVAEFRSAMSGHARSNRRALAGVIGALAVLAAVIAWRILAVAPVAAAGVPLRVNVHRLSASSAGDQALGDSLATELVRTLHGSADLEFVLDSAPATVNVSGNVARRGDSLSVRLLVTGAGETRDGDFDLPAAGPRNSIVDSLAWQLLLGIWQHRDSAFGDLPKSALPRTPAGLNAWARAEALWAGARFDAAERAFNDAIATDPSCALCDLRLMLVSRWLRRRPDTTLTNRVVAALGRFPLRYQQVVSAGLDTVNRWAALDAMIAAWPRFDLAQFVYGDEVFHRGALVGKARNRAIDNFNAMIDLRPRFAPAWQHLAWVAIAEGERMTADSAIDSYERLGARDDETKVILALLKLGHAWRFTPGMAPTMTQQVLADPGIATFDDLFLAPRYLSVFDVPAGVLFFGEHFEHWPGKSQLRTPGIVAQVVALSTMGLVDSARATLARLRGDPDPEYALVAGEFEAAQVLFDSLDAVAALPRLTVLLGESTREGNGTLAQRRRAAWMLALVARRARETTRARDWSRLVTGESGLRPFARLLQADAVADSAPGGALRQTDTLLALDSAGGAGDPFFRSALHLMRAQWQNNAHNRAAATRSLLWYQNYDLVGHFQGVMEAADIDVAFGTAGRWYRARLLDQVNAPEVCDAYAGVERLWARGDPSHRERAAQARAARLKLGCTP